MEVGVCWEQLLLLCALPKSGFVGMSPPKWRFQCNLTLPQNNVTVSIIEELKIWAQYKLSFPLRVRE